jgi:hypothetical protein
MPPFVITVIFPVVALLGTIAVILVADLTRYDAFKPLILTPLVPVKFLPVIVTMVPTDPPLGRKFPREGFAVAASVEPARAATAIITNETLSADRARPVGTATTRNILSSFAESPRQEGRGPDAGRLDGIKSCAIGHVVADWWQGGGAGLFPPNTRAHGSAAVRDVSIVLVDERAQHRRRREPVGCDQRSV